MISSTVLAVLALIEQILPLVMGSKNSQTTQIIDNIINALQNMLPYIVNEVQTVYAAASNIIATLSNSGALTPTQIAATQALGSQVDAAWNSVASQIDPDNPANAGTAAGDPGTTS
jgi:phage-related protein